MFTIPKFDTIYPNMIISIHNPYKCDRREIARRLSAQTLRMSSPGSLARLWQPLQKAPLRVSSSSCSPLTKEMQDPLCLRGSTRKTRGKGAGTPGPGSRPAGRLSSACSHKLLPSQPPEWGTLEGRCSPCGMQQGYRAQWGAPGAGQGHKSLHPEVGASRPLCSPDPGFRGRRRGVWLAGPLTQSS